MVKILKNMVLICCVSYQICVEVLDGLRICFNTFLFRKLLVNEDEQAQYYEALKITLKPPVNNIPLQYD